MSSIFFAFDRPIYLRLIPNHIADVFQLPQEAADFFKKGAFSVSLSKQFGRAVGVDECHEMKINKDIKQTVTRPTEELMAKLINSMPFTSKCVYNLKTQLQLNDDDESKEDIMRKQKGKDMSASNVEAMLVAMEESEMLPVSDDNKGLWNFFLPLKATSEQTHDLLSFRTIGESDYEAYVKYRILHQPSSAAPQRRKRLQTFSETKKTKARHKQIQKEEKLIQTCMKKRQLVMLNKGNILPETCRPPFIAFPRAIADENGLPHKANKSLPTTFLEARYRRLNVIIHELPSHWVPDSVLLEGMFMIQSSPCPGIITYKQYANMLFQQYIFSHIKMGVKEIHVIFDDPADNNQSPKQIEREKRDNMVNVSVDHHCINITASVKVPANWRGNLLNCRGCKRALCHFLCEELLEIASSSLGNEQNFFVAGGFLEERRYQCWGTNQAGNLNPYPEFRTTTEETDLKIWLHCQNSYGTKKLLFSPDTDIYHIGLPLIRTPQDVYVQLHSKSNDKKRFVHLNALIKALNRDPDLSQIQTTTLPNILQILYIATGCDYISFFRGIGKTYFLSVFFQLATFITSGRDPPGTLIDTDLELSQLSFIRLIGCAYFKKHSSGFAFSTPESLFHSISESNLEMRHREWLACITQVVWERTTDEMHTVPSYEALILHWKRCLWVKKFWAQANKNEIEVQGIIIIIMNKIIIIIIFIIINHYYIRTSFRSNRLWMVKKRWKVEYSMGNVG